MNRATKEPLEPLTSSAEPSANPPFRLLALKFGVVIDCSIRNPDEAAPSVPTRNATRPSSSLGPVVTYAMGGWFPMPVSVSRPVVVYSWQLTYGKVLVVN